jgi:hypothetical protein
LGGVGFSMRTFARLVFVIQVAAVTCRRHGYLFAGMPPQFEHQGIFGVFGVFGVSVKFTFEDWSRGVASGVAVAGRTFCIDSYSIGPISVKEPQG